MDGDDITNNFIDDNQRNITSNNDDNQQNITNNNDDNNNEK